ncbi:MAG: hypothetical protein HYW57_06715 [Ignavibacteriales bacterium]|nr:hypothetical protein [Ignavibacteriales bacterium]
MGNRILRPKTFLVPLILILALGCKDEFPSEQDFSNFLFPDSSVSYGLHVQKLFDARCIRCHNGSHPQTDLDLISPSYNKLMNYQPRLVLTRDPDNSILIQRLAGVITPRMPLNATPITENQLNGMRQWVLEGAVNN